MIYEFVNPNKGFYVICVPLIKVLLPWRDWDCLPFERNSRCFFFLGGRNGTAVVSFDPKFWMQMFPGP